MSDNSHEQYRPEVEQRWGKEAYEASDQWWQAKSDADRARWTAQSQQLQQDWIDAAEDSGISPDSPRAQKLAHRHVDWLRAVPGTPAHDPSADLAEYVCGLASMYVADERFANYYGGIESAKFVRDALLIHMQG